MAAISSSVPTIVETEPRAMPWPSTTKIHGSARRPQAFVTSVAWGWRFASRIGWRRPSENLSWFGSSWMNGTPGAVLAFALVGSVIAGAVADLARPKKATFVSTSGAAIGLFSLSMKLNRNRVVPTGSCESMRTGILLRVCEQPGTLAPAADADGDGGGVIAVD